MAFVILPKGYPAKDVDKTTIQCNGANAKRVFSGTILFPQVFGAIFKTSDLIGTAPGDKVPMTVTGIVKGNIEFKGSSTVKVIQKSNVTTDEIQDYLSPKDTDFFTNYYNGG